MNRMLVHANGTNKVVTRAGGNRMHGSNSGGGGGIIYFQDGFENGNLSSPTVALSGWSWGLSNSATGQLGVSSTLAKNGTYSLKFPYPAGADLDDGWEEQRFVMGSSLTEAYVRFWLYIPANYAHRNTASSDNNKFFRIWCTDYNYTKLGASLWYIDAGDPLAGSRLTYERINSDDPSGVVTDAVPDMIVPSDYGAWMRVQMYYKLDTGGGNARFKIWKNEMLKYDSGDFSNPPLNGSNVFTDGYILGYSNSGFAAATTFYVDDYTMSSVSEDYAVVPPMEAPSWVSSANLQTDYAFNEAEGQAPSQLGWAGEDGWNSTTPASGKFTCRTQVVDATAPRSATSVARSWALTGLHDDADLGLASATFRPDSYYTTVPIYEKVFMTTWFRYSPNWVTQASAGSVKFSWLPANYGNANNNWFIHVADLGGGQYKLGIVDNTFGQFGAETGGALDRDRTVILNYGEWVRLSLESHASHNGAFDGSCNLWVNGVDQGEVQTAVRHSSDSGVAKANIHGIRTCGYFGGSQSTTLTADQYIDLDHFTMWASD